MAATAAPKHLWLTSKNSPRKRIRAVRRDGNGCGDGGTPIRLIRLLCRPPASRRSTSLPAEAAGVPGRWLGQGLVAEVACRAGRGALCPCRPDGVCHAGVNVQTLVHDDRVTCPACSEHVHLTEERVPGLWRLRRQDHTSPAAQAQENRQARERKAERDLRQRSMPKTACAWRRRPRSSASIFAPISVARTSWSKLITAVIAVSACSGSPSARRRHRCLGRRWIDCAVVSSKGDWSLASQRFLKG